MASETGIEETFKAIRQACSAHTWSKAVELVRASAVAGVSEDADEIVCRVRTPERAVAPTVTLYPEDEEWDCNCESKAPCCEHVAAAVIAARRAQQEGLTLQTDQRSGAHLVYRFKSAREHLVLERWVAQPNGQAELLDRSISSIASSAADKRRITPSQADIAIDRLMGNKLHGPLVGETLEGVLRALADAPHIELDGVPIKIESTLVKPHGYVCDHQGGFKVVLERDPRIAEVLAPGVVRLSDPNGDRLGVLGETDLTGRSLERLPSERSYGPRDVSHLVTEVLPQLLKRFPVEVRTQKLPQLTRSIRPSIVLEVEQEGNTLSVLPKLVYGSSARVDGAQLVYLGGDVPIRDEDAERRAARRLKETLSLTPGSRMIVSGEPATALAARLDSWQGEIQGRSPRGFIERTELEAKVDFQNGALSIEFRGKDGARHASAEAVLAAWQGGLGLVPLSEGGWAPLPAGWLERHGRRVADLLDAKRLSGKQALPAYALPGLAQLCVDLGQPPPGDLKRLEPLIAGFEKIPEAPQPPDLRAELRDYQRQGVNWLCFLRDTELGATLADDM
ncbi:MAG TPA: SWIM zinc finger family protein, partial [Polyangiaceae bacterium]|nr:SWIM zinc finger family protein [Polyangiaceae bacterium]